MSAFARWVCLVGSIVTGAVLFCVPAMLSADPGAEQKATDEAAPPARSWYVAADARPGGDGSFVQPFRVPQEAVNRARAGDFIYLRGAGQHGEFTHQHAHNHSHLVSIDGRRAQSGEPEAIITLKSYPGEQAVIRGRFTADGVPIPSPVGGRTEPLGSLQIQVTRSHWKIEGLRFYNGKITVGTGSVAGSGPRVRNVWVVGNTLTDVAATRGNFGVLRVSGQPAGQAPGVIDDLDPADIFFHHNTVRTLWGVQQDSTDVLPWYEDRDVEHHAAFMLAKAGGRVELVGNDFSECASIFYSKWLGPGPTVVKNNYFHTARAIAFRWRSFQPQFEGNVFARFTLPGGLFNMDQGDLTGVVFRNNTFDFGRWTAPGGRDGRDVGGDHRGLSLSAADAESMVFENNVFLGRELFRISGTHVEGDPPAWSKSRIDGNCVIWDDNFIAARGPGASQARTWEQYRTEFGHDAGGVRIVETDRDKLFADPDQGDYRLIGEAAARCAGKGAALAPKSPANQANGRE